MAQFNSMFEQLVRLQEQSISRQLESAISSLQAQQGNAPTSSSSFPPATTSAVQSNMSHPNSVSTPPATDPLPSKVKIATPANFHGTRDSNVELWLFEMLQYLNASGVPENQRVRIAAPSLKGVALQWWRNQSRLGSGINPIQTWEQFAAALTARFQPIASSRSARVQVRALRQGQMSVSEYASKFQALTSLITDMSEADQMEFFILGLRSSLVRDVEIQTPINLEDAIQKAQRIEAITEIRRPYYTNNSSQYDSSRTPSSFSFQSNPNSNPTSTPASSSSSSSFAAAPMELGNLNINNEYEQIESEDGNDYYNIEYEKYLQEGENYEPEFSEENSSQQSDDDHHDSPMHLQAIQTRSHKNRAPYLSQEEFTRCMKQGLCLRCKRPGHVARDCPLPPRQSSSSNSSNSQSQFHRFPSSASRRGGFTPSRRNF